MADKLTVTFDDPDTLRLLMQYRQYLHEEGVDGTLQEAAAGLIVGCLDENRQFARWAKDRPFEPHAVPSTVTTLPAPKTPAPARSRPVLRAIG
jgi:hypothetical protein